MNLKNKNIQFALAIFVFVRIAMIPANAQESENSKPLYPKFFLGIGAGAVQCGELNTTISSLSGLTSVEKNTWSGTFELGYFFGKSVGLSTGIEYSNFSYDLALSTYENKFTTLDTENESYERRITGSGIKEIQDITFLKVPLCLNLRLFPGKRVGLYLMGGVDLAFPIKYNYSGSGTFTYIGYYPAYNVTLQNLPAYGFSSDAQVSTNGEITLKPNILEGLAGAGINCFISKKIQVVLGAFYTRSLSTISGYTTPEKFQLSSDIDNINSMMGGSSNITAQTFGVRLGLRFFLK